LPDPKQVIDLATAIRTLSELWDVVEGRRGRICDDELMRLRRSYESAEWMLQQLLKQAVGV
jgi:hypothetical protein